MAYNRLHNLLDDLKELIYPLETPKRVRTVPLQVLAVGPSRSGTDSLRAALIELGYSHAYHGYDIALSPSDDKAWWNLYKKKWRGYGGRRGEKQGMQCQGRLSAADFDTVIGHCAAITDMDAAVFAHDLIFAYPDAKVVLNIRRDRDAWIRSCQSTILRMKGSWALWVRSFFCSELFWAQESFLRCLWPTFYRGDFLHTAKWVLDEHCALVRGSVGGDSLLEWSPEDGWEPLCKFLGKPVPNKPFPSGNTTEDYNIKVAELYQSFNRRADKNMMLVIGWLSLLVVLPSMLLSRI